MGVSNSIRGTCCFMFVLRFRDPSSGGNVAFERGADQVPAGRKKIAHGLNRGRECKTIKPRRGGRSGAHESMFSFVPPGLVGFNNLNPPLKRRAIVGRPSRTFMSFPLQF